MQGGIGFGGQFAVCEHVLDVAVDRVGEGGGIGGLQPCVMEGRQVLQHIGVDTVHGGAQGFVGFPALAFGQYRGGAVCGVVVVTVTVRCGGGGFRGGVGGRGLVIAGGTGGHGKGQRKGG